MKKLPKNPSRFLYPVTASTTISPSIDLQRTKKVTNSRPETNQVALYLRRARLIDAIRVILRTNDTSPLARLLPLIDSFVATHALRSAPSPNSALSFFHTVKTFALSQTDTHLQNDLLSQNTLYAIAKRLALAGQRSDLQMLISAMNAQEFPAVLPPSPMNLLHWHAAAGDLDSATIVFEQLCAEVSGKNLRHPCTEAYNIMMDLYIRNGHDEPAVLLFRRMIEEGANPNSRTFTVVIEHLTSRGNLDAAMEVFSKLPSMRVRRTSRQFSVLANGLSAVHQFDAVKTLLSEMQNDGILPCHSLHSAIMRLREAGYVQETEEFVHEFKPDDRIEHIGYFISDEDEEEEEEEEEKNEEDEEHQRVQLKPWLDPRALAGALRSWKPNEVLTLENAKFVWTSRLICKILRAFKKPEPAWEFFCWSAYQSEGFTHDVYSVSRMILILARHGRVELVNRLLLKIKCEGIHLSFSTLRLIIESYGLSKEADAALYVFREMNSICGRVPKFNLLLLYSSLLRTLIKCKRGAEAIDYLDEMVLLGILPDIQTFSGLLQYFALDGNLRMVQHLFGMVKQSRMEPDAHMYQIIIRAYCKKERAPLALMIFQDMWARGLRPDLVTKRLLVKSLWNEGRLREAAGVEERCEEVQDSLPVAVPGHVWTMSFKDLQQIFTVYSRSFLHGQG